MTVLNLLQWTYCSSGHCKRILHTSQPVLESSEQNSVLVTINKVDIRSMNIHTVTTMSAVTNFRWHTSGRVSIFSRTSMNSSSITYTSVNLWLVVCVCCGSKKMRWYKDKIMVKICTIHNILSVNVESTNRVWNQSLFSDATWFCALHDWTSIV